jgi:DNA-binding NarL/FixJ family response regulator
MTGGSGDAGQPEVAADRSQPRTLSLVLADQHPIVLQGMQHLFESEADFDVRACCTDDTEALAAMTTHRPAILVLDPELPHSGGLALLRDLAERGLTTPVVLLASSINPRQMEHALRLGVRGAVLRRSAPRLLIQCVRRVDQGEMWVEHSFMMDAVGEMVRHRAGLSTLRDALTSRELEVLALVGAGLRNRDITTRLDIAEGTVKIHIHNIYEKLGVSDRLTLALRARDAGLA